MRLLGAGCFVFGGLLLAIAILSAFEVVETLPPILIGGAMSVLMLALVVLSVRLFNPKGTHSLGLRPVEEQLRELEEADLLASSDFQALRAFAVEELEDEGLHYFLELTDGRVLFLSGQYLYDYEPISDHPGLNQSRRFPCTDFTVRRHKAEGYVVEIQCRGEVIEPEMTAPSFSQRVWQSGGAPEDGEIVRDFSYEALKAEHSR